MTDLLYATLTTFNCIDYFFSKVSRFFLILENQKYYFYVYGKKIILIENDLHML